MSIEFLQTRIKSKTLLSPLFASPHARRSCCGNNVGFQVDNYRIIPLAIRKIVDGLK